VIDKEDQKAEVEPHKRCNAAEDVADAVEVPLSELLAQHACLANLMEEKNSELLAISEERAAQAFQAAVYEEEAARLREWTYAYQAAAKAEALTAQRCRSEMVTAVQELERFHRMRQLQENLLQAPVSSLEPIVEFVECESSSTQSSPEEGGPGHADICPGLSAVASTVDQTDQEMKALISRLQDELLEAEADRATTLLQRDEAQEALMSLQQEHSALICCLRRYRRTRRSCTEVASPGTSASTSQLSEKRMQGDSMDPAGRLLQAKEQLTAAMEELRSLRWEFRTEEPLVVGES